MNCKFISICRQSSQHSQPLFQMVCLLGAIIPMIVYLHLSGVTLRLRRDTQTLSKIIKEARGVGDERDSTDHVTGASNDVIDLATRVNNNVTMPSPCHDTSSRCLRRRHLLPTSKEPSNPRFLKVTNGSVFLYLYSAFWDDRETLHSEPVIRIITVTRTVTRWVTMETDILSHLRCVTVCRDDVSLEVSPVRSTKELQIHPPEKEVDRRQVICVPEKCRDLVTLSFAPPVGSVTEEWVSENMLPVETYLRPETRQNLVVCVAPMHGSIDPYRLVEWFEMVKLLGVDKVVAYNESLDERSSRIMRHYRDQGYLDVWQMDIDYMKAEGRALSRWRGPVSMSDCLYRSMYRYDRLLGMDFDELIIPRETRTLPQLIAKLEQQEENPNKTVRTINYAFVGSFFVANTTKGQHFSVLHHNYRQNRFDTSYKKSIVYPLGCLSMMNHYCHKIIPGLTVSGQDRTLVDTDVAFVHHYRPSIKKRNRYDDVIRDDFLLRYSSELLRNLRPKLNELGL